MQLGARGEHTHDWPSISVLSYYAVIRSILRTRGNCTSNLPGFPVSSIIPHAEFLLQIYIRFLITHHEKNYS